MVRLTKMTPAERAAIRDWPVYPDSHTQMDYTLRAGGWLDVYGHQKGNRCYAAYDEDVCVGFSLLIEQTPRTYEFRLAVHPAQLGKGYGDSITRHTLSLAFARPELEKVDLIVRKNNPIARHLYEKHGFRLSGERTELIQGQAIAFFEMCLSRTNSNERTV